MVEKMTKEEAAAYARRWELLEEAKTEELRNTPMEVTLQQMNSLMASVKALGWEEDREEEDAKVRDMWLRLRAYYGE